MRRVAFNQDLKAVVPQPAADGRFMFYWFRANASRLRDLADEAAHGTKRIQTERLLAFPVRRPSLTTQRAIADHLDALDRLLEPRARPIRALRDALLPELVSGRIGAALARRGGRRLQ
jgi:type I restriction enzyme, S subunit